jgi:hypothetical protein
VIVAEALELVSQILDGIIPGVTKRGIISSADR